MNARGTRRPRGRAGSRPRRARGGGRRKSVFSCSFTLALLPLLLLWHAPSISRHIRTSRPAGTVGGALPNDPAGRDHH